LRCRIRLVLLLLVLLLLVLLLLMLLLLVFMLVVMVVVVAVAAAGSLVERIANMTVARASACSLVAATHTAAPVAPQPQTVMDNCSELCHALHKILSSSAENSKSKPVSSPARRPPPLTVQSTDLLGLDVEGVVHRPPLCPPLLRTLPTR
jgi:hypothetical protein